MADGLMVGRAGEHGLLPEGSGQGFKAEGFEEILAKAHHCLRVRFAAGQNFSQVIDGWRGRFTLRRWCHQVRDVAPLLGPHVPQQVGGNHAVFALRIRAILRHQLRPHVGVDFAV